MKIFNLKFHVHDRLLPEHMGKLRFSVPLHLGQICTGVISLVPPGSFVFNLRKVKGPTATLTRTASITDLGAGSSVAFTAVIQEDSPSYGHADRQYLVHVSVPEVLAQGSLQVRSKDRLRGTDRSAYRVRTVSFWKMVLMGRKIWLLAASERSFGLYRACRVVRLGRGAVCKIFQLDKAERQA